MNTLHKETGSLGDEGARLYYEVAGEGHPLLLIHAGIADSRMWDEQFSVFAQHYRVIRYDMPHLRNSITSCSTSCASINPDGITHPGHF